jgi:hypothetical protein
MASLTSGVLRRVLAPSLAEVSFAARGFPGADSPAAAALEAIPQAVVCGFEWGIEAASQWELTRRLDLVDPAHRGFAYEGATMAAVVLDVMGPRRGRRARDLVLGPGHPHIFLTYIGVGFALSRLPRALWRRALPDLTGSPYHPVMSWLAVDGYGFDRAYFSTRRWVDEQYVPKPYPWDGSPAYFPRAVDQGIGRALWFIHGARPAAVTAAVARFAAHRQRDLLAGVGLAASFAGGCGADDLAALRDAAGERWPELAVGAVFAAKARRYAGHAPPHTEVATRALAGVSADEAVAVADGTSADVQDSGGEPPYERWRERIRRRLVTGVPVG